MTSMLVLLLLLLLLFLHAVKHNQVYQTLAVSVLIITNVKADIDAHC